MKYYIFTSEAEAKDYDDKVTALENYPIKGDNWANPRKHPTKSKWAIEVNSKLILEDKKAQELDSSWTPK